jgi:5-methylcytosine-specific restriction endonuclease McrA
MKTCSKCLTTKPLGEFNNSKNSKDGKFQWCRQCCCEYAKAFRARNADRVNEERRAKYAENKQPTLSYMRERYWRDPEARRLASAEWRKNNPEKSKALNAGRYVKNKEVAKAYARTYYQANKETCLAKGKVLQKRHYEANKDQYYTRSAGRRAAKSGARGVLSRGIRKKLFTAQDGKCVYCHTALPSNAHLDHIMPLAKGGPHTDENVQLLCPDCNLSKGAKSPDEFLAYREGVA